MTRYVGVGEGKWANEVTGKATFWLLVDVSERDDGGYSRVVEFT